MDGVADHQPSARMQYYVETASYRTVEISDTHARQPCVPDDFGIKRHPYDLKTASAFR